MRIPITWLKDYVDLPEGGAGGVDALAERLTLAGLEVEAVHRAGAWWDPARLVVGQVVAVRRHPAADRLALVEVDYGQGRRETVVTGAPGMLALRDAAPPPALKVALALAGAVLVDAHGEARPRPRKALEPAEIRGVPSRGMICSERELGLSDEHDEVLVLAADAPVGTPLGEALAGEVLDIAITPDMARCMCVVGVAREVAALTGAALRLPDEVSRAAAAEAPAAAAGAGKAEIAAGEAPAGRQTQGEAEAEVEVVIADPARCRRFVAAVVRGVAIGPAPPWVRERLRAAGMQAISNVVDVTNFVMLELGQPMHAYDYDQLAARAAAAGAGAAHPSIEVRAARPGEEVTTLDGVRRALDGGELLIADAAGPLGVAGVMGGSESGIGPGTVNVLLEAANFDGLAVRQAARQLKLHTEASSRFTRGVPAALAGVAMRRAAALLAALAGGRVTALVDRYPVPQPPRRACLTASEVRRQLGVELAPGAIRALLERLDFEVEVLAPEADAGGPVAPAAAEEEPGEPAGDGGEERLGLRIEPGEPVLRCTAPWHRLDVELPADLVEEVARMVGYDQVPATRLADTLPPLAANPLLDTEERLRDLLAGCGLQEHINYTLTTVENHERLGLPSEPPERYVTLDNPLSANRRVLRRSLLVSAVEALPYNLRYTDRVRAFELGRVYLPEAGDGLRPREERRLSVLLTGRRRRPSVHADPAGAEPADFFDLSGVVEAVLQTLGWGERAALVPCPGQAPFGPRCAEVRDGGGGGARLGVLGELHPEVAERFGLAGRRVALAELAVEPLVRSTWEREPVPPISNYPAVVEDLAFVVADGVPAHDLAATIRRAGAPLLAALELFDLYRGEPLPAGTKSLAFHLAFQSPDATLGSAEVAAVRQRIEQAVAETLGGKLRT